jgi:hypothetical protein
LFVFTKNGCGNKTLQLAVTFIFLTNKAFVSSITVVFVSNAYLWRHPLDAGRAIRCNLFFVPQKRISAAIPDAK